MTLRTAARRLEHDQLRSSPIREIMKLTDRKNILAMGLDPDDVISFAGGWVNHAAPEGLRESYRAVADDPSLFHELGAYSPTRGLPTLRQALLEYDRAVYGTEGLADEHLLVGQSSTQLTHTLFTALLDPGDTVLLFDPSYANYGPQLALGPEGVRTEWLSVFDPEAWSYMGEPDAVLDRLAEALATHQPRLLLFSSPDNPTGQLVPDEVFFPLIDMAEEAGCHVIVDLAYRAQVLGGPPPAHFSASPSKHPNLIRLHSNSKWCRGLGRRLGWIEAAPEVVETVEIVQQGTNLCPDTLHQHVLATYLETALADGSLETYLAESSERYARAGARTVESIRRHLGARCLDPQGGLYTVMDAGRDGDEFARDVLANTGVILVPGIGFGPSLRNGVRVSFGPLVDDLDRIDEGFRRVAGYLDATRP
jgi:aspartate/methionine/tyrosine aminotransferase